MRRYSLLLRRAEAELDKINKMIPKNSVIADQQRTIVAGYKSILAAVNGINTREYIYEQRIPAPCFNITEFECEKEREGGMGKKDVHKSLIQIHREIKKPLHCRWCSECGQMVPRPYFQKHLKSGCTKHIYGVRKFKHQIKNNKKKEGTK